MKKIICLLLLLTLVPGVQAGDKKKKKDQSSGSPITAPGGGGGGGGGGGSRKGGGLSGLPQMGQSTGHSKAQRPSTGSVPKVSSQAPARGHSANPSALSAGKTTTSAPSSNPLMRKGGQAGAKGSASNPLTRKSDPTGAKTSASNPLARKGGQAGGGDQSTNPLKHADRPDKAGGQAANPMDRGGRQAGAKSGKPMGGKGAAQAGLGGRSRDAVANGNYSKAAHNRGAQTGRGYSNRTGARNWQRGSHANYRVRSSREVFHNYRPARHDRVWYTSRYDRVVVVGGGYYYWDAGYWYPAWGYDPAVSIYVYDGPIYSYDNLPPDQVTMDVQTALQDDGYYTGDIDGLVGPKTRDALGAYQTEHDLEVTSAIDEPTVESLGLAQS
jgi:Putative peptidoglycan binding domain